MLFKQYFTINSFKKLPDLGVVGRSFGMPWANRPPGGIIGKGPLVLVSALRFTAVLDDRFPVKSIEQ